MLHLRHVSLLALGTVLAVTGPAAAATPKYKVEERCYYVGNVRAERTIDKDLMPAQLKFRSLTTRFDYALTLKGQYKTWWDHGRWEQFNPKRYLIQGGSSALAARHPKGKPLTSLTELKFHSTESNVGFSAGLPGSFSFSWDSEKKVLTSKDRATAAGTAKLVDSGGASVANPFTGKAGKGGAHKISVRSAVIAARGTNGYYTPTQSWRIARRYEARDSPFPLQKAGCDGLAWGN